MFNNRFLLKACRNEELKNYLHSFNKAMSPLSVENPQEHSAIISQVLNYDPDPSLCTNLNN